MLVLLSDRPKSFYSKSVVTASILYVIYALNLKVRLYCCRSHNRCSPNFQTNQRKWVFELPANPFIPITCCIFNNPLLCLFLKMAMGLISQMLWIQVRPRHYHISSTQSFPPLYCTCYSICLLFSVSVPDSKFLFDFWLKKLHVVRYLLGRLWQPHRSKVRAKAEWNWLNWNNKK